MYLYRGACRECNFAGSNCADCTFDKEYKCLRCLEGYTQVVSNGVSYCVKCPDIDHCLECVYNSTRSSQFQCTTCADPWLVDTATGTCFIRNASSASTATAISCSVIGAAIAIATTIALIVKCQHHRHARSVRQVDALVTEADELAH